MGAYHAQARPTIRKTRRASLPRSQSRSRQQSQLPAQTRVRLQTWLTLLMIPVTRHGRRHVPPLPSLRPKATTAGHGGGSVHATGFAGWSRRQRRSRHRLCKPVTAAAPLTPQAFQAVHDDSVAHAPGISGRPRQQRRSRHKQQRLVTATASLMPQTFQAVHGSRAAHAKCFAVHPHRQRNSCRKQYNRRRHCHCRQRRSNHRPTTDSPVEIEAPPCAVALRASARASDHQLTQTEVTLRCIRLYTAPGGPHGSPT